ncbi:hypothetical protein CYMTET_22942 [Cymbomonas tetramitiformis]|uniref:Uncharacterized protein n=1 Tax=Cymbomonas tetramitiformis TaxID=36881 RepID=A0AAE0L1Q2_9CHLO|nr:hypothetical protein CYMTET_22942 [Cymbomonas tetramitiformis]
MTQMDECMRTLGEKMSTRSIREECNRLSTEGGRAQFTNRIKTAIQQKGWASQAMVGGGHWVTLLIRIDTEGEERKLQAAIYDSLGGGRGNTDNLKKALDTWAREFCEVEDVTYTPVTLMMDAHQTDGHSCGIWVAKTTRHWKQFHEEGNCGRHWETYLKRTMQAEGDPQAAMLSMRERLKNMVLPIIIKGNTDTGGQIQPGEMEITGEVDVNGHQSTVREPSRDSEEEDEEALLKSSAQQRRKKGRERPCRKPKQPRKKGKATELIEGMDTQRTNAGNMVTEQQRAPHSEADPDTLEGMIGEIRGKGESKENSHQGTRQEPTRDSTGEDEEALLRGSTRKTRGQGKKRPCRDTKQPRGKGKRKKLGKEMGTQQTNAGETAMERMHSEADPDTLEKDALADVEILKVKAHVGITGNEEADKAAKQACEDGEYVPPWDNDDTVLLRAMATDQENVKYPLKGKNAIQTYVTSKIREANESQPAVRRWNRTLTGKPTEWVRRNVPHSTEAGHRTQEQELDDMLELEREGQEDMEWDPLREEDDALLDMMEQTTDETTTEEQERQRRHQMVVQEEERRAMLEDPRPRTNWAESRATQKEAELRRKQIKIPSQVERTTEWMDKHMKDLIGDKPIHKLSNEHWKQASFAERRTILKSRYGVLPLQSYEAAKAAKTTVTDCPLEGWTVYEHNKRALNKMGMNNKETEKTLKNLNKTTVGYANSLYWLYRKRIDEQRKKDITRAKDTRAGQDHPT